jgi:hypothetical protein
MTLAPFYFRWISFGTFDPLFRTLSPDYVIFVSQKVFVSWTIAEIKSWRLRNEEFALSEHLNTQKKFKRRSKRRRRGRRRRRTISSR